MQLAHIQSLLTDAIFDDAALTPALEALAAACDAPVAQLMLTNAQRSLLRSSFGGPLRYDLVAAEADYQEINPRVAAIPSMRPGHVSLDRDYITKERIQRDPTYQDLIIACGLGHMAAVPLAIDPDCTGGFAIHRPWADDAFTDNEAAHIQRTITAACAPVFRLMRKLHQRDARSALAAVRPATPAATIDASGRLLEHNEAFDTLLAGGAIARRTDGRLNLHPQSHQRLIASLNRSDGAICGRFSIRPESGDPPLIAELLPLPHLGPFPATPAIAIVTLEPVNRDHTLEPQLAADLYGLTRSEIEVANLLCKGRSLAQIARRRNVSGHTIRSVVKSLMAKTETHRQAQLVALLAPLTSPTC